MADLIVVMNEGRVQQVASPRDLYARPANTFCARFIGTPPMNLIPAAALAGQGGRAGGLPAGSLLGIRPEDIRLAPGGVPARLAGVEYLGADQLAAFEVGPAGATGRVLVRLPSRQPLTGQGHSLAWPPEAEHVFDAGGQRLGREVS